MTATMEIAKSDRLRRAFVELRSILAESGVDPNDPIVKAINEAIEKDTDEAYRQAADLLKKHEAVEDEAEASSV